MRHSLQHIPNWTFLRAIGNAAPLKLTVLIPLVGYLIIFNVHIVGYLDLTEEFGRGEVSGHSSVPIRLLAIYFGLCALALGSLLYSFGCPSEVKRFPSSASFVAGDGGSIGDYAIEDIEERLRSTQPALYKKIRDRFDCSVETLRLAQRDEFADRQKQARIAFLHQYFAMLDGLRPSLRLATLAAFTIGFGFLLAPSAKIFCKVVVILAAWALDH